MRRAGAGADRSHGSHGAGTNQGRSPRDECAVPGIIRAGSGACPNGVRRPLAHGERGRPAYQDCDHRHPKRDFEAGQPRFGNRWHVRQIGDASGRRDAERAELPALDIALGRGQDAELRIDAPGEQIDDGLVFNQLPVWVPDAAQRKTILVENPARLYGF